MLISLRLAQNTLAIHTGIVNLTINLSETDSLISTIMSIRDMAISHLFDAKHIPSVISDVDSFCSKLALPAQYMNLFKGMDCSFNLYYDKENHELHLKDFSSSDMSVNIIDLITFLKTLKNN